MCSHFSFLFFRVLKGPYWLAHYQSFWNAGHSSIEAPLWITSCKIETNVLPMAYLFSLCTWELNFGQTIWDKTKVIWGTFWVTTWEPGEPYGNTYRAWWEQGKKEKRKNPPPPLPSPKKKKSGPLTSPCWAFHWLHETFISKTVCHHFCRRLMAWQPTPKKKKENIPPPSPSPKRKKTRLCTLSPSWADECNFCL